MRWLILVVFLLVSACDTVEPDVSDDISASYREVEYFWVIENENTDDPYAKRWVTQSRYTRDAIEEFIGASPGESVVGYVVED